MYPVMLTAEQVTLREFRDADADGIFSIVGDDRVTRWLSFDSRSREEAQRMLSGVIERAQLAERTEYYLAVTQSTSPNRLVGFARLALSGVRAGKLGYAIHADHWGCGYATDAVRALINFGFDQLGLHRLSAAIGPENHASIAVVQKLGFTHEGCIRDHVWTNGAWRDSDLYSLLAHEWVNQRSAPGPLAAFRASS